MPFATDRDLLMLEPTLFHDLPLLAQQRVSVSDASVTGTTLTSMTSDFVAAAVDAGAVVLIDALAHEVVERVDANTLTVSLPRIRAEGDPIPGKQGSGLPLLAQTFLPQIETVHQQLLRTLNAEATQIHAASVAAMRAVEVLGTLSQLFHLADEPLKAASYHQRLGAAWRQTSVEVDLDGDGKRIVPRRPGVVTLRRR